MSSRSTRACGSVCSLMMLSSRNASSSKKRIRSSPDSSSTGTRFRPRIASDLIPSDAGVWLRLLVDDALEPERIELEEANQVVARLQQYRYEVPPPDRLVAQRRYAAQHRLDGVS